MKKLILSLFLVLVASSYAVPNFVNSKRAEERGYKVVQDTEGTLSIQKVDDESATTISYWYGVKDPDVAELNKVLKETVKDLPYLTINDESIIIDNEYVREISLKDEYINIELK